MRNKIDQYDKEMRAAIVKEQQREIKMYVFSLAVVLTAILLALAFWPRGAESQTAPSRTVVFGWTQNTEPDLAGYRLYQNNESFSGEIPEGMTPVQELPNDVTATSHAVGDGEEWFFVLTAFDFDNNESGPSNECSEDFQDHNPPAPPNGLGCAERVEP